ncbi:MAG: bacterioferritin [Planctomycetes bacterium]|nr:bacterioferritin [Planctomycetota bacterium]
MLVTQIGRQGNGERNMVKNGIDTEKTIKSLNNILELELAGVVRYLHYSLMVFGHARIPIIKWMRDQAGEGMNHAALAGEHVTTLGGHPSLKIGKLVETEKHDIDQILREALQHERDTLAEYYNLLSLVEGKSVWLEEYAREQIQLEEAHIAEVEKMLRRPGDLKPAG